MRQHILKPRRALMLAVFGLLLAMPCKKAHAGFSLAASVGVGGEVSPLHQLQATNLMLAPGWDFFGFIRPELGILGSLQAARQGSVSGLGLELRPMVVLTVPLIPVYARLVFASVNPGSALRTFAYGGALGVGISLVGLGIFAELGVLPRSISSQMSWVLEGRAGVYYIL